MGNRTVLKGKTALITGATKGIGKAVSHVLAQEGVNLILVARTETELQKEAEQLKAKYGVDVLPVAGDMSKEDSVRSLFSAAFEYFSVIDILINNVGVGKYGPLTSLTVEDYDWMMNSNMRSTFLCTHAILPQMLQRKKGWIVFIGSVAGLKGLPHESVYCASKCAQTGFAQALDYEVRKQGIKISLIAPGGVNTHFAFGTGRTAGDPNLEKMMDAEDVAEAVLFALKQPDKARIFLLGMRPMSEPL